MNLIITDQCNRSCPYCFAGRKVIYPGNSSDKNTHLISMEAIDWFIGFTKRSGINELKLLGGEPSLHPNFTEIVSRGLDQNLKITIFTNGLWPSSVRSYFHTNRDDRVRFIFNLNEPHLQSPSENEKQSESLAVAGSRASVGFNIYQENFDLLFIRDLMDRFSLKRQIRLGLASPIVGADNHYLQNETFRSGPTSMTLPQMEANPLTVERARLPKSFSSNIHKEKPQSNIPKISCPSSTFSWDTRHLPTDLKAWPCFPLSGLFNIYLPDFDSQQAVDEYYQKKTAPLRSFGSEEACINCKYLKRGQCSGGCLARTINAWTNAGDTHLIEKLDARFTP